MSNLKVTQVRKTVTTAGSPVQLSLTSLKRQSFLLIADPNNTGTLYVGDSAVVAASALGIPLAANESVTLDGTNYEGTNEKFDASLVYVDATVSGDTLIVSYNEREVD